MDQPIVIDLFCGCGGMSLGSSRAGFNVVAGIDKDTRALASHTQNFPNAKHLAWDLSETTGAEILKETMLRSGEIDVVVGGPPCQGFSTMGKRDHLDPRNLLIWDFFRVVRELSPRAFLLENVPGVLDATYKPILDHAKSILAKDYEIDKPHNLVALDAGAPTYRTRVFVFGVRKGIHIPSDFWKRKIDLSDVPVVRHALDGLPVDINSDWKSSRHGKRVVRIRRTGPYFEAAGGRIPKGVGNMNALDEFHKRSTVTGCIGTLHSRDLEKRYAALDYGKADRKTKSVKLDPDGYCPTLRAGTGPERGSFQAVRPIHYLRPRVITPREAARLQGFPDWYLFDKTKWHSFRQIGNSVSPIVADFVMEKIAGVLNA